MASTNEDQRPPLAIVGVSALFPGSSDVEGFWRDIFHGRDRMGPVPPDRWLLEDYHDPDPAAPDKTYATRGAFLSPQVFDTLQFGMPPNLAPTTDSSQLLALIVAQQVLDDATRGQFAHMDRSRVSCILGVTSAQELLGTMVARLQRPVWTKALRESGLPEDEVQAACDRIASHYVPWKESTFPGVLGNVIAGRIANRFDLRGTNCVTDAACASAFSALSMAANELYLGESDLVITGGVDTMNDIFMFMCFSKTPALSPSGDCRPFSDAADGTMLGEGLAMVALKRLADAERDGDHVYAVVRGIGSSSDGRAKSVYAPVASGQARALRRAYEHAGYTPATVELVEAHGTGTKAGDAAEFGGLVEVFAPAAPERRQWCALGSVKSQIGHTKSTAGAAGLVKAALALHHGILPPTLKVERPNPKLELASSPFYLNTRTRPWVRGAAHPRRASVSSFGFGGTNFHVALEEYTDGAHRAQRFATWPAELVAFCGNTAAELASTAAAALAADAPDGALRFVAHSSRASFDANAPFRLCVVATNEAQAASLIADAVARIRTAPDASFSAPGVWYGVGSAPGPVAFLFSGQGSQYVNMGADVAMAFPVARAPWDATADLSLADDDALYEVVFPRPVFDEPARDALEARLTQTQNAQPAIGLASVASLALLRTLGVEPEMVAGHSFGELTALHAAGAWDLATFAVSARVRGVAMARAAANTSGAMTALAATIDRVDALLAGESEVVVANHNAPTQVVVSGTCAGIERIEERAAAAGISARRLNVSTAFHSPLVGAASADLAAHLASVALTAPSIPVFSNRTAARYPTEPAAISELLAEQIVSPVRYVEMLEAMYEAGARIFVEVGPGSIQSRLVTQCLGPRGARSVATDQRGRNGVTAALEAVAQLAALGVPVALARLDDDLRPPTDPRATIRPPGAIDVSGANVGAPYPPPGGAAALPPPNPPRPTPAPAAVQAATPTPERFAAPEPIAPRVSLETPQMSKNEAPPPSAPPMAPEVAVAWVSAFAELQRQTAEAHANWQRAMADSHMAFLRSAEASLAGLHAMLGVPAQPPSPYVAPPIPAAVAPFPAPTVTMPVASAPTIFSPAVPAPLPAPAPFVPAAPPVVAAAPATVAAPAPVVAPAPVAAPAPRTVAAADPTTALLAVVADKTGYPVEMLNLDMALEADLGVDSIKRVEILSALAEKLPGAAADPNRLASLQTLREIAAALGGAAPTASAPAPVAAAPARSNGAAPSGSPVDAAAALLAVVADKTGYPVEMLRLDMALEADLGVDSIKRVEILSALAEKLPSLPALDSAKAGALATLGDIVQAMAVGTASPSPSEARAAEVPPNPKVGRFEVLEAPANPTGLRLRCLAPGATVRIAGGPDGLAAALALALRSRDLVVATERGDAAPDCVISLHGLAPIRAVADADRAVHEVFALARETAPAAGFVAVADQGGSLGFGAVDAAKVPLAGIGGIVKTALLEWPNATGRYIDLQAGDRDDAQLAAVLVEELLEGGPEVEVGLRADGRRITAAVREAQAAAGTLPLGRGDLVVVSGGARGVTAACVIALARATGGVFALLGRTPLHDEPAALAGARDDAAIKRALLAEAAARGEKPAPAEIGRRAAAILAQREVRETIDAVQRAGGLAHYVVADVVDADAIAAALAPLRAQHGPVRGVVHGAGVLADREIAKKTDEMFDRVWRTKVDGFRALLAATATDPLAFVAAFSSVAARTGNVGQCDYAAANEVLNDMIHHEARRRPGCCAVAFGWGPWRGGMVDAALEARFASLGVPLIELAAGASAFVDELRAPGVRELVLGGRPVRAALASAGPVAETALLELSSERQPWLLHHVVAGAPVLPIAGAIEWLVRFGEALRPGWRVAEVRDLRVLRPVRLADVDGACFELLATGREPEALEVELRSPTGVAHYRATLVLEPGAAARPEAGAVAFEADASHYGGTLFHGPALRVLGRPDQLDANGVNVPVAGLAAAGWATRGWRTDLPAVDGALQLALLWTERALGAASLPMSIGRIELRESTAPIARFRGVVTPRAAAGQTGRCDVDLLDENGVVRYALRDVSTVLIPSRPA